MKYTIGRSSMSGNYIVSDESRQTIAEFLYLEDAEDLLSALDDEDWYRVGYQMFNAAA